jgi:Contractile injection system tube protein
MERVAFLLEHTGERLACLLNPDSLVLRRRAGLRTRQSAGGLVTGAELADDPIFFTGGGTTELTLNLLFDVNLVGSSIQAVDVRELTGPLWQLAENARSRTEQRQPPAARLIWGKSFNVRGVIAAVAERLEYFTEDGVPQRSWLRMRLLRVAESDADLEAGALSAPRLPQVPADEPPVLPNGPTLVHSVFTSGGSEADAEPAMGERLDQIAFRYYGDPEKWRVLAWLNDIADPLCLAAGQIVQIATREDVQEPGP